jgi:hypothetical protein
MKLPHDPTTLLPSPLLPSSQMIDLDLEGCQGELKITKNLQPGLGGNRDFLIDRLRWRGFNAINVSRGLLMRTRINLNVKL